MYVMAKPSRQCGQGLVGFAVASVFLVIPLTLGINYVARLGDVKHKSYEAARYAVWERTVWHQSDRNYNVKPDLDISREINKRIFSKQTDKINSSEDRKSVPAEQLDYDGNLYVWGSPVGEVDKLPIIRVPDQQDAEPNRLFVSDDRTPGGISSSVSQVASTMLDLSLDGFYNASIELQLEKAPQFKKQFDNVYGEDSVLKTQSTNAMLVGAWNANGPGDISRKVGKLIPTTLLDNGVIDTLRAAASTAGFEEFDELEFGKVDPERVPCQRLVNARGSGKGC